jgi:hypothetical protein
MADDLRKDSALRSRRVTRKRSGTGIRRNSEKPETASANRNFDWRTTDKDEIAIRQERARTEQPKIRPLSRTDPIFSGFEVQSPSGMIYNVEIRSVAAKRYSCTCVDFRTNGLGTCKHIEAVLLHLEARFPKLLAKAQQNESDRIDIVVDRVHDTLRVENSALPLPRSLANFFDDGGLLKPGHDPVEAADRVTKLGLSTVRLSQEVSPWLEQRLRRIESINLRREYEEKVQAGIFPPHETLVPLLPYQRDGMLHLAFNERALLADEMGLGKTIQAISACALLHRLGKAVRVLIVTPASLKTEWEEQIQRFTKLSYQVLFGPRPERLRAFRNPPFFTIVNYEQMVRDTLDVNRLFRPDVVVLDEAQRIKNWNTKTAQAIKRLESRFAFVLTGTPVENRIDELYSIIDFLNPSILGPLFRFNREFYQLDDRGRPTEYRNLERLHERVRPLLLRRRKADVETELPGRTDRNLFVSLSLSQKQAYSQHEAEAARLVQIAKRRPLTKQQQEKLMRELAMMRMICDTNYILDPNDRICPKLQEIQTILDQCLSDADVKVVIFSEWERMLELVQHRLQEMQVGYAWHTGSVAQRRRRAEIQMFKGDAGCRVFLSTDSGGVGLNLQVASVVVNCDLPWNPAKLEQRIARAWRKNQIRSVTVINLVAEGTIEQRMLGTLAAKKELADGVLDRIGDLSKLKLARGGQMFLSKLEQLMTPAIPSAKPVAPVLPIDSAAAFAERASELIGTELVACEERFPDAESHSVLLVVVRRDPGIWLERLGPVYEEIFGSKQILSTGPVRLEVIDQFTADSLDRFVKTGLLRNAIRATRHLFPKPAVEPARMSDEEQQRFNTHREKARRKLKIARVLAAEDFLEEARQALQDSILYHGVAYAVETRLPEPEKLDDVVKGPLAISWGEKLPLIRDFLRNGQEIRQVIQEFQVFIEPSSALDPRVN